MRLPNKLYSYKESTLAGFPCILEALQEQDYTPAKLYKKVKASFDDIEDFEETLVCLYALRKIELIEYKGVLHYVAGDQM